MRVTCLERPLKDQCAEGGLILKLHGTSLLLDFPLLASSPVTSSPLTASTVASETIQFLPPLIRPGDAQKVDCVLLSHHTQAMGLPFLTEYTPFSGEILATLPTVQMTRLMLEELVEIIESRSPICAFDKASSTCFVRDSNDSTLDAGSAEGTCADLAFFRTRMGIPPLFTKEDVARCIAKITPVSYGEVRPAGGPLTVVAASSGGGAGASNWIISAHKQKVCWLVGSSLAQDRFPLPLDRSVFSAPPPDAMVVSGLNTSGVSFASSLKAICHTAVATIQRGGSCLIPVGCCDVVFDLIDALVPCLPQSGFATTPIYWVSPRAHTTLLHGSILSEWLCTDKQERSLSAESPFNHDELLETGQLVIASDVNELGRAFKEPCVVLAGHSSLRAGPALTFLKRWRADPNSTLILIDREYDRRDVLRPFADLRLKVVSCPLDPRLSPSEAAQVLSTSESSRVVLPKLRSFDWPFPAMDLPSDTTTKSASTPVPASTTTATSTTTNNLSSPSMQSSPAHATVKSSGSAAESGSTEDVAPLPVAYSDTLPRSHAASQGTPTTTTTTSDRPGEPAIKSGTSETPLPTSKDATDHPSSTSAPNSAIPNPAPSKDIRSSGLQPSTPAAVGHDGTAGSYATSPAGLRADPKLARSVLYRAGGSVRISLPDVVRKALLSAELVSSISTGGRVLGGTRVWPLSATLRLKDYKYEIVPSVSGSELTRSKPSLTEVPPEKFPSKSKRRRSSEKSEAFEPGRPHKLRRGEGRAGDSSVADGRGAPVHPHGGGVGDAVAAG
eukprot:Rmarinus@m.17910